MTDISICFGTTNRLALLRGCVDSIRKAVGNLSYEIVVTDGGSIDGTLEYLHAQKDVFVIEHGNLRGAVAAYRDAVEAARGEYVCYLSDDLTVPPGMLSAAVEYLKERPGCGVVALPYQNKNTKTNVSIVNNATIAGVSYPFASYGVLRRADGVRVDWFPRTLYHYFLDTSLCIRLVKAGMTIDPLPWRAAILHFMADNITRGENRSAGYSKKQDDAAFIEEFNS